MQKSTTREIYLHFLTFVGASKEVKVQLQRGLPFENAINILSLCARRKFDGIVGMDLAPTSHCLCVVHRVHHPSNQLASVGGGWASVGEFDSDAA